MGENDKEDLGIFFIVSFIILSSHLPGPGASVVHNNFFGSNSAIGSILFEGLILLWYNMIIKGVRWR